MRGLCERFRRDLTQLKLRLFRSKLDYRESVRTAAMEIGRLLRLSERSQDATQWKDLRTWWAISFGDAKTATIARMDQSDWSDEMTDLLRCWLELARGAAALGDKEVAEEIHTFLREPAVDCTRTTAGTSEAKSRRIKMDLLHSESERLLNKYPMWKYFDSATHDVASTDPGAEVLLDVERMSQESEDYVRMWARSASEYAYGRAYSLTSRARALYVRGHFREAHRVLTLSLADLGEHTDRDRFALAVTHLYRAELLAMSANEHLHRSAYVLSSIRKIETALGQLDAAARWLEPSSHRPMWWLRIYVGRAQVRHEQLLYQIRRLAEQGASTQTAYGHRSIWMEQCVLDGLRSIRLALDMLPFTAPLDQQVPALSDTEHKLWALWLQLFIAAFGYNHLLVTRLQVPYLTPMQIGARDWAEYVSWTHTMMTDLRDNRIKPLAVLINPVGFWETKWAPWCRLQQFHDFAEDPCKLVTKDGIVTQELLGGAPLAPSHRMKRGARTLREDLIDIERRVLDKKNAAHETLWKSRRGR